jgi:GAF domain-containing protein
VGFLPREQRLVEAVVDAVSTTGPGLDVPELLYNLAASSVDLLGAGTASVQIANDDGALDTIATCGEDDRYIELFAEHMDDGPGAESYRRAAVVSAVDLDGERFRWPAFATKARALGFRSVHGIPMRSRDHVLGALSLLRTRVGPLVETELAIAQCIATVTTLSLVHDRAQRSHTVVRRQLEGALESRIVIEQAKGCLARDHDETPKEAFVRLRNFARRRNMRITVAAEGVITRELDVS